MGARKPLPVDAHAFARHQHRQCRAAIGTALGPSLGGVLIDGFGWRLIFLINVPLGILNFYLAVRTLPADGPEVKARRASFDVVGTLLLALSLTAYAMAMTVGKGRLGLAWGW